MVKHVLGVFHFHIVLNHTRLLVSFILVISEHGIIMKVEEDQKAL
jgi:hypothetical protein